MLTAACFKWPSCVFRSEQWSLWFFMWFIIIKVQCVRVCNSRKSHPGLVLICPHTSHCLIWRVCVCVCVLKPEPSPASCSRSHGHKVPAGQKSCRQTSSRSLRKTARRESLGRLPRSFWGASRELQSYSRIHWAGGAEDDMVEIKMEK